MTNDEALDAFLDCAGHCESIDDIIEFLYNADKEATASMRFRLVRAQRELMAVMHDLHTYKETP